MEERRSGQARPVTDVPGGSTRTDAAKIVALPAEAASLPLPLPLYGLGGGFFSAGFCGLGWAFSAGCCALGASFGGNACISPARAR